MANYQTPHQYMEMFDQKPSAYCVEQLQLSGNLTLTARFDVMEHNERWMALCEQNSGNPPLFVNMAHVISLRIVAD